MAFAERSTIAELISRYTLEPSLHDIFVEGKRDRSALFWFLTANGFEEITVREIGQIEISSDLISARGLRPGRRGAVISLGLELCDHFGENLPHVVCLADRDGEDVTRYEACRCLAFTDFACFEIYFFDPRVIGKLLAVGAAQVEVDSRQLLNILTPVLNQLFAIRQANLALNLGLDWLSFERCCELTDDRIVFDLDDFARRYLNKGAKLALLDEFGTEIGRQSRVPIPDPRMRMNGHDFAALLAWYLDKSGLRRGSRADDVAEMLRVTIEAEWLADHPLFKSLFVRFGG